MGSRRALQNLAFHPGLPQILAIPPPGMVQKTISCDEIVQMRRLLPKDQRDENARRWFIEERRVDPDLPVSENNPIYNRISTNNEVKPYIYGRCAFADMVEAIKTANGSQHRIYLLGWFLNLDFDLLPGQPSSIKKLFQEADNRQVAVRVMLYNNLAPGYSNDETVKWINKLTYGAAIHDSRVAPILGYGSQHQKVLIVCGQQNQIAFAGGMDIHYDRSAKNLPLHDVHVQIRGPATKQLLFLFRQRWQDHPESAAQDNKGGLSTFVNSLAAISQNARLVQVGRTYPNGANHGMVDAQGKPAGYTFLKANQGETTAWEMIKRAIGICKQFIYLEDQYLVDYSMAAAELAGKLRSAPPGFRLIILASSTAVLTDMNQVILRRHQFYQVLKAADPNFKKWGMYQLIAPKNAPETEWCGPYVHSKTWIFDDAYAIVGSANCQRRCYTHDSEVVAGIADDDSSMFTHHTRFARELRMALWRKHLGLRDQALWDGVAAAALWRTPPPSALINAYDAKEINIQDPEKNPLQNSVTDYAWDQVWDPDGS